MKKELDFDGWTGKIVTRECIGYEEYPLLMIYYETEEEVLELN